MQDIDLKGLVYEAYQKGSQELLYVVPFAAKVLESCSKSKVSKVLVNVSMYCHNGNFEASVLSDLVYA